MYSLGLLANSQTLRHYWYTLHYQARYNHHQGQGLAQFCVCVCVWKMWFVQHGINDNSV